MSRAVRRSNRKGMIRSANLQYLDVRIRSSSRAEVNKTLELQMSCRAVRHRNRKIIIRSASVKYLDARTRSATRAGTKKLWVPDCFFKDDDDPLNLARAADELQSCSAQQSQGIHQYT
eukprot:7426952-Pyramimonas_sp.AAC.1